MDGSKGTHNLGQVHNTCAHPFLKLGRGRDAGVCFSPITGPIMASLTGRATLEGPAVAKISTRQ